MTAPKNKKAIPKSQYAPRWQGESVLEFQRKIRPWLQEREEFLLALTQTPHYYEEYTELLQRLEGSLMYGAAQSVIEPDKMEDQWKSWERDLVKLQEVYVKAINYLDRINYWAEKKMSAKVRFDKNSQTIYYYDPNEDKEQEFIPTRRAIWFTASQKIYEVCRQKGSYISSEALYEHLRISHSKCAKWTPYKSDSLRNWKLLSDNVNSANRWAKTQFQNKLFDCSKERVTRLL